VFPYAPGQVASSKDAANRKRLLTSHDWQDCNTPQVICEIMNRDGQHGAQL